MTKSKNEYLRNLLFKSTKVFIDYEKTIVYFIGKELDKCRLKVNKQTINDIATVCNILGIEYVIY